MVLKVKETKLIDQETWYKVQILIIINVNENLLKKPDTKVSTADVIEAMALFLLPFGTAVTHSSDMIDEMTAMNEKTQHIHINALISCNWPVSEKF